MTTIRTRPAPAEAAAAAAPASGPTRGLLPRRVHRLSAWVLAAYALPHLVNHLFALGGIERHLAFMRIVRLVVRLPAVEALLLACVAFQVASGAVLLVRRRRSARVARPGPLQRAQAVSGAYLAFFLLVHVGAVLNGRWHLGLDTNFYFAAAGLRIWPYPLFFIPYYALAIVALTVHLACAIGKRYARRQRRVLALGAVTGTVLAAVIVATFAGVFYPVAIPPAYEAGLRWSPP